MRSWILWVTALAATVFGGAHALAADLLVGTTTTAVVDSTDDLSDAARGGVPNGWPDQYGSSLASRPVEGSAPFPAQDLRAPTTPVSRNIATKVASLADEGFIHPASIRFSQSSVSPNFSAGGSIDDMAAGLRNGAVVPGDVPPIRILENNGQWMTLDNPGGVTMCRFSYLGPKGC